ncbi:MAG: ABC transporter substrate-binding protein [Proteobacteria bacterium]|nr:ABC transporter substrate-binding protein [Pseudomonadota bacterium]
MDWRREFNRWTFALGLALLTGAAAAAAPAAEAEARFATIAPGPSECPATPAGAAFLKAFRDLGYAKDPVIDARCFSQPDDIPRLVAEVLARKPPLVVVWGSIPAVHLLRQSAPATPVIFVNVADPVQYGLVQSLSRPGGNITGIASMSDDLLAKRVELLRVALPSAARLAVLCSLSDPPAQARLQATLAAARSLNFDARAYPVVAPIDLAGAFDSMAREGIEAVVVVPDPSFYVHREQIIALALAHRLPMMSYTVTFSDAGGLFVYAASLDDMSYRAAAYVDKVLKGARPADIPVQLPEKFEFIVNRKAARDIGLNLPKEVLLRATRVMD